MPDVKQSLTVQERLNQGPAPLVGRLFTPAAISVHLISSQQGWPPTVIQFGHMDGPGHRCNTAGR